MPRLFAILSYGIDDLHLVNSPELFQGWIESFCLYRIGSPINKCLKPKNLSINVYKCLLKTEKLGV